MELVTLFVIWRSLASSRRGDVGVLCCPAKTCNCMLQLNLQSNAATWWIQMKSWVDLPVCRSNSTFHQITSVLLLLLLKEFRLFCTHYS